MDWMHSWGRGAWRTRGHCDGRWDPTPGFAWKRVERMRAGIERAGARVGVGCRVRCCCRRCWLRFEVYGKPYSQRSQGFAERRNEG